MTDAPKDQIAPALTATVDFLLSEAAHSGAGLAPMPSTEDGVRQIIASLGFSQEDVVLLRKIDGANDYQPGDRFGVLDDELSAEETLRLRTLVARIASLLPPPPPETPSSRRGTP